MKIYTKQGDKGKTSLYYSKEKIFKDDKIFEALGDLDELGSHIGMLISLLSKMTLSESTHQLETKNTYSPIVLLRNIQRKLLDIGSVVCSPTKDMSAYNIKHEDIQLIELEIDEYEKNNKPLTKFILSGVNATDAQSHICRSVCRRLERHIVSVSKIENNNSDDETFENILIYINRLSDFFFVFARYLSNGEEELR